MAIISESNHFCGIEKAVAGDVIQIVAPPLSPVRTNGKAISSRIAGSSGSVIAIGGEANSPAHILHTVDISHGATLPSVLSNGDFSAWSGAAKPAQWTVVNDSGTVSEDGDAIRIFNGLTGATTVAQDVFMVAGVPMRLSFEYKTNLATKYAYILVWDRTTGQKLSISGTWGASDIGLPDSVGVFSPFARDFTPVTTGRYTIQLFAGSRQQPVWFSNIVIRPTVAISWAEYESINALSGAVGGHAAMLVCSHAEWASSGCEALRTVDKAASLALCLETPNSSWFAAGVLYLNSGADSVSSLHIEYGQPHLVGSTITSAGIVLSHAYNEMQNIRSYGANGNGLRFSGGASPVKAQNIRLRGAISAGVEATGAGTTAEANDVIAEYGYDDGINSTAGAVLVANRCFAIDNWDEGFEAWGAAGVMYANFCVAARNGRNGDAGSEGMVASDTATLYARHCTSINNMGRGLRAMLTGTLHAQNCVAYGNGVADVGCVDTASLGTCSHNVYGVADDGWIAKGGAGTGTFVGDPLINHTTYKVSNNSRACNSGLVIAGVNDGGETDIYGVATRSTPNVGMDQAAGAGFGPWSTITAPLPLSAQPCKGHALPIGTRKITAFPGVATAAQINEAAE